VLSADERRIAARIAAIEPGAFRSMLELAHRHEQAGEPRAAAATYRTALQAIPRVLPPAVRPVLEHAKAQVDANDDALKAYLAERLAGLRKRCGNARLDLRAGRGVARASNQPLHAT
jgi:hypothetical protein